ncbi:MAG: VTT domain-containing protein [Saprospiraceae bacterium]|nr:VTT domain-containing protein [Saprospiraceae bacterium]MDZ4702907.1 VTT domain-containing protein [Saprospiraceae bacterium]
MNRYLSVARKGILLAWIAIIGFCGLYYLLYPEVFTASYLATYLLKHKEQLVVIYSLLSVIRGFTLLPSTPLVLAGALIFPLQPFLVLFISMAGILASSAMIYYFADRLGLNDYFANKYPKKMGQIREQLERPSGMLFLFFWAFFPVVPTDLASYVAGVIRMNFWKFIAVVFLGELLLCWACIWGVGVFW